MYPGIPLPEALVSPHQRDEKIQRETNPGLSRLVLTLNFPVFELFRVALHVLSWVGSAHSPLTDLFRVT